MRSKRILASPDFELVGLLLFILVLPFHLVVKKFVPQPWGTYWKEILLGLLFISWLIRYTFARLSKQPHLARPTITALDLAVLCYISLLVGRFIVDGPTEVSVWGFYISALYLPLYWLVQAVLSRQPGWITRLLVLLVGVGGVVALGGVAEFVLNMSLWPSAELTRQQGSPDVFIYSSTVRRVYFTFDSPTALANTLALLLPLAVAILRLTPHFRARLIRVTIAGLISVCLIVTFSRGIWVSIILAFLIMGFVSFFAAPARRVLALSGGVAIGLIAAFSLSRILPAGQAAVSTAGTIELSPEAHQAAPVTSMAQDLLVTFKPVTQTWTLADPIREQNDTRAVLFESPSASGKAEIVYRVKIPEAGALRFAIALSPEVWSPKKGDGASFQIFLAKPEEAGNQTIFVRYINPKHSPSDRRWRNFLVDLSPWAGQWVNLSFIVESGPHGDFAYDWGGWAEPQIVTIPPSFFATPPQSAIVRHVNSILNWSSDETNRDRLMAWKLGFQAWQRTPLWGNGLGTTGVAALRTNPDQAFATESQVLKTLVELGLPGLLILSYLWFQIARTGYLTYQAASGPIERALIFGILTSLLVVFIEGWVYQNLEVKQVNAYFWILVGLLSSLSKNISQRQPAEKQHLVP